MHRTTKFLGVVLILVAATCLVAGGINLNSTLADKNYWENKGAKSDADLMTLETGLNTLKKNEQAYLTGRETYNQGLKDYEQGQKDLAAGQQEYDEGVATLAAKQQEYDAGLAELQTAEQKLAAGKQTLDANYQAYIDGKAQIAQYEQGQRDYQQGLADYNAGQAKVENGTAQLIAAASTSAGVNLETLEAAEQYVAENTATLAKVKPLVDQIKTIQADYYTWLADYNKINAFQNQTSSSQPLSKSSSSIKEYKEAIDNNVAEPQKTELQNILSNLESRKSAIGTSTFQSLLAGMPYRAYVERELTKEGFDDSKAIVDNVALISYNPISDDFPKFITDMDTIGVVSNATVNLYENGQRDIAAFNAGEAELNAGKAQLAAAEPQLATAKQTLDANYQAYVDGKAKIAEYEQGLAEYNAGLAEYNAGKIQLDDGAVQLAAGREQLTEAAGTIAAGKQQLSAAEQQLEDGKSQLDEYETGRDQAIDGIKTALATETYGDLASIADRVGPDFEFVRANGDLDINQGLAAVTTAREFSADNTNAVTHDITIRLITTVAIIVAGLAAAISSIIEFRRA